MARSGEGMAGAAGHPARPLVVRCGAFGDMVLITALIRDLAARFHTEVDVLTSGPWSEPLLRGQTGVGEILVLRSRKTPYWLSADQRRVVRRLKARGIGPTWFCDGNDAALPLLRRAGVADEYIVNVRDHPLLPGEHATQQWRRLARILPARGAAAGADAVLGVGVGAGAGAGAGGCYLEVSQSQRADLEAWLRQRGLRYPLVAVQVGNKRTMRRGFKRLAPNSKYWPQDRWAAVLRHLRAHHADHDIALLGTGPENRLNETLIALAGVDRVYNAAAELTIPRLVALLERASGLLTVDSGPAHAAAAVGCPQVVLFGKASTSLYRPWGAAGADTTVLTGEVSGAPSMLGIGTAEVIAAWDALVLRPDVGDRSSVHR